MNIQDELKLMRAEWQCVFEVLQQRADACDVDSTDERVRVDLLRGAHNEHDKLISVLIRQMENVCARLDKIEKATVSVTANAPKVA